MSIGELKCNVKRQDTTVNWFRGSNEIQIKKDKYSIIERGKERILIINDVNEDDVGEYVCQSGKYRVTLYLSLNTGTEFYEDNHSENIGSYESDLDRIMNKSRSRSRSTQRIIRKQIYINDKTKTAELRCKVLNENTKVDWFKNNQHISETNKYMFEENGKDRLLVIRNLNKDDDGDYSCEAGKCKTILHLNINTKYDSEYSDDENISNNIFLSDNYTADNKLVFYENQIAHLTCYLKRKTDDIIWFKDNSSEYLTEDQSGKYSFMNGNRETVLKINKLNIEDSGRYICQNKSNSKNRVEFQVLIKGWLSKLDFMFFLFLTFKNLEYIEKP